MPFRLELTLRSAEGALMRVIGMAERRGYRTTAIHGRTASPDGGPWKLKLTLASDRTPEQLARQLRKLHDCLSVEVLPTT